MWFFGNKKEKIDPKEFDIPKSHYEDFLKLYDDYYKEIRPHDKLKKWKLWNFIAGLFPEVDDGKRWRIDLTDILNIKIVQILENNE